MWNSLYLVQIKYTQHNTKGRDIEQYKQSTQQIYSRSTVYQSLCPHWPVWSPRHCVPATTCNTWIDPSIDPLTSQEVVSISPTSGDQVNTARIPQITGKTSLRVVLITGHLQLSVLVTIFVYPFPVMDKYLWVISQHRCLDPKPAVLHVKQGKPTPM